jgi:hypothetical protein
MGRYYRDKEVVGVFVRCAASLFIFRVLDRVRNHPSRTSRPRLLNDFIINIHFVWNNARN